MNSKAAASTTTAHGRPMPLEQWQEWELDESNSGQCSRLCPPRVRVSLAVAKNLDSESRFRVYSCFCVLSSVVAAPRKAALEGTIAFDVDRRNSGMREVRPRLV